MSRTLSLLSEQIVQLLRPLGSLSVSLCDNQKSIWVVCLITARSQLCGIAAFENVKFYKSVPVFFLDSMLQYVAQSQTNVHESIFLLVYRQGRHPFYCLKKKKGSDNLLRNKHHVQMTQTFESGLPHSVFPSLGQIQCILQMNILLLHFTLLP